MKTYIRRTLPALLMACMLLPFVASIPLSAAEDPFSQWRTDGWTQKTEDGIPTLVSPSGGGVFFIDLKGTTTGNVLSFAVRIGEVYSTADANIGAAYTCPSGDKYFFEYNTALHIARIRRLGVTGSDVHVGAAKALSLPEGEWLQMEMVFQTDYIRWMVNGETLFELTDTGEDMMSGGSALVQCYNTSASLRDIRIESETIETVEKQNYDFEFKTADSVKNFTADKGSVTWQNGKLIYTVSGKNSVLTSPPISVESGDPYAMLLPLRNTLAVRMKNGTSASEMKVRFTTTTSLKYSEDKAIVCAVEPNSDYVTYFFNLGDAPSVPGGYLYGFSIEPVGTSSGTIEIEAITFEREATLYDWAGTIDSCTATEETVTIKGSLKAAYAGKTVQLYETVVENYTEALIDSQIIAEVKADGTSFTIEIPFQVDNMNRLPSLFLVGVDGVKLSERFCIENIEDFSDNPYHFDLPAYSVKVTDAAFGAKGDAFTNDNAAIQAAIDHVSAKGGGKVIVPGDDSRYGRRYVITNLKMKDHVELHIEEGAILWQSPRPEDYDYDVLPAHDVVIPGINWTHTAVCHNYPLIQLLNVQNVKLTGKGALRSVDTGSENLDSVNASTLWTGCKNRIHLVPIGLSGCQNVEISGISLRRTNVWHIDNINSQNVYIGDVSMMEVTCASGDGIGNAIGTRNVVIDRCFLYSNDDAITLSSSYNDPRGLVWWFANPGADNSITNFVIRNNNIFGGHGITFIPWGTDDPELDKEVIRDIEIYNNHLSGNGYAIGAWPDNPYFGKQPYDNTETDDFAPVQAIRIHDNVYRGQATLDCIQGTDIVTDTSIRSTANFQYGDFERGLSKKYAEYTVGLSNWTILKPDGYKDGNITAAGDKSNHYGLIQKAGGLAQGLWMSQGEHTFTVDTAFASGDARLIVRDIVTGDTLAEQSIKASADFTKQTLTFTLAKGTNAYVGVLYTGSGELKLDNADVTSEVFEKVEYFTETFDDLQNIQLTNNGFTIADGTAQVVKGQSGLMTLIAETGSYEDFDLHLRVRYDDCMSDVDANFGITFRYVDDSNAYNVNYNPLYHYLQARIFQSGAQNEITRMADFDMTPGEWVDVALRVQDGKALLYWGGEKVLEFDAAEFAGARIAIVAYNINCAVDDVQVAKAGTTRITGDEIIETEPVTEPETNPVTEPVTDPSTETEPVTNPDTNPETDPATDPKAETDPETMLDSGKGCASDLHAGFLLALLAGVAVLLRRRRYCSESDLAKE